MVSGCFLLYLKGKTYVMKRLLSILLLLLGALSLQAAPVSANRALDIAKKIFAAQPATKAGGGALHIVWDGEEVATKAAAQPAFYVVARDGGGFVIVAGDDNVPPILAISDRNEFQVEGMPENVKWWMNRMKAYVRVIKTQEPEVKALWADLVSTKAGASVPTADVTNRVEHLTPEWGQRGSYHIGKSDERQIFNSKCPKDADGNYTATGCVATAIGELVTTLSGLYPDVMPTCGTGTIEPYPAKSGHVSASTVEKPYVLNASYDWENLRQLTGTDAIKAAADNRTHWDWLDNMDQLLADLGAVMHSSYSAESTSADTQQAANLMAKYFGFNKAAYYDKAANYSAHQWREKLKGQLVERPILYRGNTSDMQYGHAFVFDGYGAYGGADVFHVNFGWNGYCNGYYIETDLDADFEDPEMNFSWNCGAFFDFYPDPSSTYRKIIKLYSSNMGSPFGFRYTGSAPAAKGDLILTDWIAYHNEGHDPYDGKIRLAVLNEKGDVVQELYERDFTTYPLNPGDGYIVCLNEQDDVHVAFDISLGDRIVLQYTVDDRNEVWEKVTSTLLPDSFIDELPLIPLAFIRTEDSYKVGDWFDLRLMNHDRIYAGTKWTFTDPDGKAVTIEQSEREFQLTKKGVWMIEAAVAPEPGTDPVKAITTYISVR